MNPSTPYTFTHDLDQPGILWDRPLNTLHTLTHDLAQTSTLYTHLHMILPSQPAQGTSPSTLYRLTHDFANLHTLHTLTHDLAQISTFYTHLHMILPRPPHSIHTYTWSCPGSPPRGPAPPHFTHDLAQTSTLTHDLAQPAHPRDQPLHTLHTLTHDPAQISTLYTDLDMILPRPPHFTHTHDLAQTSTLYINLHLILSRLPHFTPTYTWSCPACPGDLPLHTLHKILPGPPHFTPTYTWSCPASQPRVPAPPHFPPQLCCWSSWSWCRAWPPPPPPGALDLAWPGAPRSSPLLQW